MLLRKQGASEGVSVCVEVIDVWDVKEVYEDGSRKESVEG